MEAIRIVEAGDLKKDRGGFKPGDTVKVMVKVVEGEKERLQAFEGVVIRDRHGKPPDPRIKRRPLRHSPR